MMKPIAVQRAVWLMWASMAATVLLYLYEAGAGLMTPKLLLANLLVCLVCCIMPWKIAKGSNYTRIFCAVLTGLGIATIPFGFETLPVIEQVFMWVDLPLTLLTFYWLFRPESNAWFKAMKAA